jgi:hypothetical protein
MADLVLEHLKRIQTDISDIKTDVRDLKAEAISTRILMGELLSTAARRDGDFESIKRRIERIETRLDLHDTH